MIELMAVVAVIAILGAMVIPTFQSRVVRQQIEEALQLADGPKKAIAAAWTLNQTMPLDNAALDLPAPEKMVSNFVSSLAVQDGVINITLGNNVVSSMKGKVLTIRPAVVPDAPKVPIAWVCGKSAVPNNMTARGADRTDVPIGFLPLPCRTGAKESK